MFACQCGLCANVLTCQRAYVPAWFTCQCACVSTCQSVPSSHFYVPTCQKTCQRAIRRASVSTWHVNVPSGVLIFQTFLLRNVKGNLYALLLYKKFYIILDIIVINIICLCIVHTNCIILYCIGIKIFFRCTDNIEHVNRNICF